MPSLYSVRDVPSLRWSLGHSAFDVEARCVVRKVVPGDRMSFS